MREEKTWIGKNRERGVGVSATRSGKQGNGSNGGHNHWSSPSLRKAIFSCVKTTAPSTWLVIPASHVEDPTKQTETTSKKHHCWRTGRFQTRKEHSGTKIFNLRLLCEGYHQYQQDLYHVFIDFKETFDRVGQAALLVTMNLYNINANLIRLIQHLYDNATGAAPSTSTTASAIGS